MRKLFTNKKILITMSIITLAILLTIGGLLYFKSNDNKDTFNEKDSITNKYTAYVNINPLIKLEFSQTCRNTDKTDNMNTDCDNPVVTKYELINEDAQTIYKDVNMIDITDLWFMFDLITNTAKEYGIKVDTVDIYSDWTSIDEYIEDKTDTTYSWTYNVNIKEKQELDNIVNSLEKETMNYTVSFNTDGGSEINSQTVEKNNKAEKPTDPTKKNYSFVEWQLDGKKFDFDRIITKDITLKAIWNKNTTSDKNNSNNGNNSSNNNSNNNNNNETTIKYDINLNDNIKYYIAETATYNPYIYVNPSCVNKTIGELMATYQNTINLQNLEDCCGMTSSSVTALNSYTSFGEYYSSFTGCSANAPTNVINSINTLKGVKVKSYNGEQVFVNNIVFTDSKYYNFSGDFSNNTSYKYGLLQSGFMGGGGGSSIETKTLTEAVCSEYGLSCGRG